MRKCIQCGTELFGRIDKKFCNDYCRNSFNNNQNRLKNKVIRETNKILIKNYHILQDLIALDHQIISRELLLTKGFDFDHFTGLEKTKNGEIYSIYEIKYQLDSITMKIIASKM